MRPDLAKLTTERERRGGWKESKKYGGKIKVVHDSDHDYDNEYGGFRSSSRHRAYGYNCKEFSDVLTPLRGALRANLGRPWDKVYSEFCENLDRRSVSGIHIFGHLCGRFGGEVKVRGLYVGDDGKVYEYPYGGHYFKITKLSPVDGFYVHPVTGILCYAPRRYSSHGYNKKAVLESLRDNKVEIDGHKFETINGIWFETWYERESVTSFRPCYVQDQKEQWYKDRGYIKHYRTGVWGNWHTKENEPVLRRKRSLNKKEIKVVKQHILDRIKELGFE